MNIRSVGWNCVYNVGYSFFQKAEKGVFLLLLAISEVKISGNFLSGDVLVIFDGTQDISYSAADSPLMCHWICFECESESEMADFTDIPYNLPLLHREVDFISELMGNITTEFYSTHNRRALLFPRGLPRRL